jgi:Fe2+ transport system protein FeoA
VPILTDQTTRVPLHQLRKGDTGRIDATGLAHDDAELLRALGLRPEASVRVCRLGHTCIVELCDRLGGGCRIGLTKGLAERVMILPDTRGTDPEPAAVVGTLKKADRRSSRVAR